MIRGTLVCYFMFITSSLLASQPVDEGGVEEGGTIQQGINEAMLLQLPKTKEDIDAKLQMVQQRLEQLSPTTQPASDTTDPLTEARNELYNHWLNYRAQIQRISDLQSGIARLSDEQHLKELSSRIESLEQKISELKQAPSAQKADAERLAQLTSLYDEMSAQFTTLSEQQTQRASQIAGGFASKRQSLESELADLKGKRQQLQQEKPEVTTAPSHHAQLQNVRDRKFMVQIAHTEMAIHAVSLEIAKAELISKQEAQHLEVLKRYVTALRKRVASATESLSRTELNVIQAEREAASAPHEVAFNDLKYFREKALLTYFNNKEVLTQLETLFPPEDLDRLKERLASSRDAANELLESVEHRSQRRVLSLREETLNQKRQHETELRSYRQKLSKAFERRQHLQLIRGRVLQRYRSLSEKLAQSLEKAEPAERARLETEATSMRVSMNETIEKILKGYRELTGRLKEAIAGLEEHIQKLKQVESQLYWSALIRRETGLAGLDWGSVRTELGQLMQLLRGAEISKDPSDKEQILLDPLDDEHDPAAADEQWDRLRSGYQALDRHDWGWVAGILIVVFMLAGTGRFVLGRRITEQERSSKLLLSKQESDEAAHAWPLRVRVHLLCLKLIRIVLIPAALCAAVWLADTKVVLDAELFRFSMTLLLIIVTTHFAIGVTRHLFAPASARLRFFAIDDVAANHFRRWLEFLILMSAVILGIRWLLSFMQLVPTLRAMLWELFKISFLLSLWFIVLPKRRFLNSGTNPKHHWLSMLMIPLHPILLTLLSALLVLQIIGYGVLVEFICEGILLSLAVGCLIGLVVEYLCDVLDYVIRINLMSEKSQDTPRTQSTTGTIPKSSDKPTHKGGINLMIELLRLFKLLLRFAGVVLTIILILGIWGADYRTMNIDWRAVGLGVVVIVLGMMVDRAMVAALQALYKSNKMPESTSNLIRRWGRALIAGIVLLVLMNLAHLPINNMWTFLGTLLAMIAIGFVAVWSVLSNIASTIIILIWKPFNVGEEIEIHPEQIAGAVIDINFMYTLLSTPEGEKITVPNSLFLQKFIKRRGGRVRTKRTLIEQLEADKPLQE